MTCLVQDPFRKCSWGFPDKCYHGGHQERG